MRGIRKLAGVLVAMSALFVATAVLSETADKLGVGGATDPVRAAWHRSSTGRLSLSGG